MEGGFILQALRKSTFEKYDAIVLAGTHRNPKRLIRGTNKSLLKINNETIAVMTVTRLLECPKLNNVIVVGPREKLEFELRSVMESSGRVKVIQQRSRMLENVWTGYLATFADGNALPINSRIDSLLLGGHLPIKRKSHLSIIKSVYSAIAGEMKSQNRKILLRHDVVRVMEERLDEFRRRYERVEWFMGRLNLEIILAEGHVLGVTDNGILFQNQAKYDYFVEYEQRLHKAVFVTACDLPLLCPDAATDFISRCEILDDDFFFSVTTEELLKPYYTSHNGHPGIIRPYMHLREARIRAANLIFVKPNKIGNKELIQESFGVRKLTEWSNVSRMIWKLIQQKHRYQTVRLAILLQTIAVLYRNGFYRTAERLRHRVRTRQVELALSHLFRTRFKFVAIPFSGVSLDIDTEEDYELFLDNYEYWSDIQDKLTANIEAGKTSPLLPHAITK